MTDRTTAYAAAAHAADETSSGGGTEPTDVPAPADDGVQKGAPFRLEKGRRNLPAALSRARRRFGGKKLAIIDADGRQLTYDDMVKASYALGSALRRMTKPGEKVALMLPTGAGSAIGFFAITVYGRVPAMLNFTAGAKALKTACKTAQATKIVTAHKFIELAGLQSLRDALAEDHEIIYLEDVREALTPVDKISAILGLFAPALIRANPDPDAIAVYLFTSGTEGDPKGVVLSHANLVSNVEQVLDHVEIYDTDIVYNPLPTFHCFGLTGGLLLPILAGIPSALHPSPLQAKTIAKRVGETKATILFATDTFLGQYARSADDDDLKSLRFAVCGAERVRDETRAMVRRRFGLEVVEGYGVTEAAPVIAVNQPGRNRPGTVGKLLPGMEAKLEPVPGIDRGGKLLVRGPNVMKGYVRSSAPGVVEAPDGGWHDTGDIVTFDEEGCITIRGRLKRFAKIGGEMVSLAVVENCASSLWPDNIHAAVAVPDDRKGEQIILVTDYAQADRGDFIAFARNHGISELAAPRRVMHVDAVPVLGTGKLDYVAVEKLVKASLEG